MRKLVCGFTLIAALFMASPSLKADTIFFTELRGSNENPPTPSMGTGSAFVVLNDAMNSLTISVDFGGLTGPAVAFHIHAAASPTMNAPVRIDFGGPIMPFDNRVFMVPATLPALPLMTRAQFVAALFAGNAYVNVHTRMFPGGEIRGQLGPVPEPGTLGLLGLGVVGLIGKLRKRSSPS